MKKNKVKKFIFVCLKKGLLISLLVSLFIFVPTITSLNKRRNDAISNKFFGKKAEYQGIITLWNVDTFEGGSSSKTSFLENISLLFEKKNKGAYIKVDNLSIDEFLSRIKDNKKPDMFSFGTGVQDYLEEYMQEIPDDVISSLKSNFLSAGLRSSKLIAVPWSYSVYSLISSNPRIEKTGKVLNNNLKDIALDLSFDKKLKKSVKHTYSITFGGNEFVNALNIFNREFNINIINESNLQKIDKNFNKNTFYEAYVNFINNKSSVLLGTNRDVFRMENRKMAGKETDVIYEPLLSFTDLVNYIAIISSDVKIKNVCLDFLRFLISDDVQKRIINTGLFGTTNSCIYESGVLSNIEKQLNEKMVVKNIF